VARRLLSMPKVAINSNVITNYALMMIASGKKLTPEQLLWFRIRRRMLLNEDNFFTSMFCDDNVDHIKKVSEKLPDKYDLNK
ncbi:D-alanyl-lipoteichoic acid biosynthesis protein DltD, partial [Streptococcus anginosus]|nr:D-alanyl-lipoteichoic acid biosynthesis protein DltD [Streptococcus anginosus]